MIELHADDWYTVTGRGQMASINLRQVPGCPERINTERDIPIRIGERVRIVDHGEWDVAGVEYARALIDPPFIKPDVCLRLRKPQLRDSDTHGF